MTEAEIHLDPGAQRRRRAHLLGHRLAEIGGPLLVLGLDRLQQVQALFAAGLTDQVAKAFLAALTALSTSAAEPIAILPDTCSVVGLSTSRVFGSIGSTHWPSM